MSAQTTDGTFTTAIQHGAKQVAIPLQGGGGNDYATVITRPYLVAPASSFAPATATRTSYTTNLLYSDDLSQTAWTKTRSSATASATTDTEGGTSCSKLKEDNTAGATHLATQTMTIAAGATTFGFLAKAAENSFIRARVNNATDGNIGIAVFNLSTGAILSGSGTIKQLLNGWYWCYITCTTTVTNSAVFFDLTPDGTTFSYNGTTGNGIYLTRATCCLSAAIGPAILTTAATVAVIVPLVDVDDPLAFLVEEQAPDSSVLELAIARFPRVYANVPAQTTTYTTLSLTKPTPISLGVAVAMRQYNGASSFTDMGTNYTYASYTWDMVNNRVYGPVAATTSANSGSDTRVTWTGHGLAGTERITVYGLGGNSSWGMVNPANYSIIDANTVDVLGVTSSTLAVFAGKYLRNYTPGNDRVGAKLIRNFYLPGFTPGITTMQDVAIPSPILNDAAFLAAVVAHLTGYVTYDAKDLAIWRGPIYELGTVQINMADVD